MQGAADPVVWRLGPSTRNVLETLLRLIEHQPGVFLVTGEASVGKSRFAGHLAAALEAAGHAVLACDHSGLVLMEPIEGLVRGARRGRAGSRAMVLLRDDADVMTKAALRDLAVLLRGAASDDEALRIVLVGGPGLQRLIAARGLARLRRHVRYHGRLESSGERMAPADLTHRTPADRVREPSPGELLAAVVQHAAGKPAQIATLWTPAGECAGNQGASMPDRRHVEQAARMQRLRDGVAASACAASAGVAPAGARPPYGAIRRAAALAVVASIAVLWLAAPPFRLDPAGRAAAMRTAAVASSPAAPPEPIVAAAAPPSAAAERAPEPVADGATTAPRQEAAAAFPAPEPTGAGASRQGVAARGSGVPLGAPTGRADAQPSPTRGTPVVTAPPAKPATRPAPAPRDTRLASLPSPPRPARQQCQPVVSAVNFTLVPGLACRDAAGNWRLMKQRPE